MGTDLPRLCGLRRVPGRIKDKPEDFRVEELPSYEPSGSGTHLFVQIEKTGITTQQAMRELAEAVGAQRKGMGCAGQKDRWAVTRQWLSLEGVEPKAVEAYASETLRVISVSRNGSKLRTGHLRGNRFDLRVVDVDAADAEYAVAHAEALASGMPNYFGPQRFGRDGDNVDKASAWLVDGGRPPRDRFKRKLFVSSLQSAAFNAVLASRIRQGLVHRAIEGDIFQTARRGVFSDEDLASNQSRMDAWEVSPTGPMFGKDMRRATGAAEEIERAEEERFGLGEEVYGRMGKLGRGTRRPLRIRPSNLGIELCPGGFRIVFELPPGAYATVLLAEIIEDSSSSK